MSSSLKKISCSVAFSKLKAAFAGFLIAERKAGKAFPVIEMEGFPARLSVLDIVGKCFF